MIASARVQQIIDALSHSDDDREVLDQIILKLEVLEQRDDEVSEMVLAAIEDVELGVEFFATSTSVQNRSDGTYMLKTQWGRMVDPSDAAEGFMDSIWELRMAVENQLRATDPDGDFVHEQDAA